ncbi:MAG: NADH-quinone oxidoreductase subunit H [Methanomassiliicoccales archaeon]|jgi:formate hydrogenlyase subunit 4|nr:NADH-quinone oxidoreductase subunit H [Methanomassiliicoccales archaeon]MDD1755898.1 NADH-quinone oxidoreductase subunit H [Methanomassiliicoccales archaeon]
MADLVLALIQTAALLALAPLLTGIIRKLKAWMQSRRGPPIYQPYLDLAKLMRKGSVVSEDSSWVTTITPYVCLISMVVAALLVPAFVTESLGFLGDLIVLVYLFAMTRFFTALAALDAGSTFGGMGSSREMLVSSLIEPAILLSFFTVALLTGTTSLVSVTSVIATSGASLIGPALLLAFAAFLIAVLAENARVPVDNPSTHLELTMIHEAMLLEYSGKDLALMEYSSMVKLTLFVTIAWSAFLPWGVATEITAPALALGVIVFLAKLLTLAVVIAVIESSMAKLRLFRLPNLLTGAFMLAFLAVMSYFVL